MKKRTVITVGEMLGRKPIQLPTQWALLRGEEMPWKEVFRGSEADARVYLSNRAKGLSQPETLQLKNPKGGVQQIVSGSNQMALNRAGKGKGSKWAAQTVQAGKMLAPSKPGRGPGELKKSGGASGPGSPEPWSVEWIKETPERIVFEAAEDKVKERFMKLAAKLRPYQVLEILTPEGKRPAYARINSKSGQLDIFGALAPDFMQKMSRSNLIA